MTCNDETMRDTFGRTFGMPSLSKSSLLGIVLAGWLLVPGAASAQPQFNLVIGYSPGAIYDAYGRLVARHLGMHLPGNPTVVLQNMPGGRRRRARRYRLGV